MRRRLDGKTSRFQTQQRWGFRETQIDGFITVYHCLSRYIKVWGLIIH